MNQQFQRTEGHFLLSAGSHPPPTLLLIGHTYIKTNADVLRWEGGRYVLEGMRYCTTQKSVVHPCAINNYFKMVEGAATMKTAGNA